MGGHPGLSLRSCKLFTTLYYSNTSTSSYGFGGFGLLLECPVLDVFSRAGVFVRLLMPQGLHRRYGLRHLHFIRCSCYRRLPLLASRQSKNVFVKILGEVRDRYGFALAGNVVNLFLGGIYVM